MKKNEAINTHFTGIDPYEESFERDLSPRKKLLRPFLWLSQGSWGGSLNE